MERLEGLLGSGSRNKSRCAQVDPNQLLEEEKETNLIAILNRVVHVWSTYMFLSSIPPPITFLCGVCSINYCVIKLILVWHISRMPYRAGLELKVEVRRFRPSEICEFKGFPLTSVTPRKSPIKKGSNL